MDVRIKARPDKKESEREKLHRALSREVASESIVLLENDGILPLSARPIALFGAGALMTIKGGTGSGEVNVRHQVSILEGLESAGFSITTMDWNLHYKKLLDEEKEKHYKSLLRHTVFGSNADRMHLMIGPCRYPSGALITDHDIREGDTDTCIYVIARQVGEGEDRSLTNHDFTLDETEILNLTKVAKEYTYTIVIINVGGSMDLSSLLEIKGINAILYYCQQGMEGGHALADVITGKVNPSGCLTSTWPVNYSEVPFGMEYSYLKESRSNKNNKSIEELYKEGIFVGYRYYNSFGIKPRYIFGYGKSYTSFSLDYMTSSLKKSKLELVIRVSNTGSVYKGKKVVQIYMSCPDGKLVREYQSLVAFAKTKVLLPGEFQDVTLQFDLCDFAAYDEDSASYLLERGDYIIRVADDAHVGKECVRLRLEETVTTLRCRNICKMQSTMKELRRIDTHKVQEITQTESMFDIILLKASDIPQGTYYYEEPYNQNKSFHSYTYSSIVSSEQKKSVLKAKHILSSLTVDEMMQLVVGTGVFSGGNRNEVPGAAGYTTSKLYHKGIHNVVLCDGPAGLRMQLMAVVQRSGRVRNCGPSMEFMEYLPNPMKKILMGEPTSGQAVHQFCTAFPVGTALAQTWNLPLLERVGHAIGTEMQEYGVTYWLAPAMNIQRNPLCGRNFEYLSEDPILTGLVATALTIGVQKHPGCYVTLKHFAANNSEYKRNYSNSVMSERTLREIYLKGFRIAVEQGKAKAVMSSYNKLNQVYTTSNHDLLMKVLRNEWGFDGVVMTDWFSTGKGLISHGKALRNGTDLIMPGGSSVLKALKRELDQGFITKNDLRRCCFNILRQILNSNHF